MNVGVCVCVEKWGGDNVNQWFTARFPPGLVLTKVNAEIHFTSLSLLKFIQWALNVHTAHFKNIFYASEQILKSTLAYSANELHRY